MRWLDKDEQRALKRGVYYVEEIDLALADAMLRLFKRGLVRIGTCPFCGSEECSISIRTTPLFESIAAALEGVKL